MWVRRAATSESEDRRPSQGRASRPYPLVNRIALGIVLALLAVGLPAGCFLWGVDPDSSQFLAATSHNYATISIDHLDCVSVDDVKVDTREFSDPRLADAVTDILGIAPVLFNADYRACPWGLYLTVVPGLEPAVRYNGLFARYLVSIDICARSADGKANPAKCASKNIYVFTPRVDPHDLFRIALIGLKRPQSREWETFQVKR